MRHQYQPMATRCFGSREGGVYPQKVGCFAFQMFGIHLWPAAKIVVTADDVHSSEGDAAN